MSEILFKFKYYLAVILIAILVFTYYQLFVPVNNFPVGKVFEIEKGESAGEIFVNLENHKRKLPGGVSNGNHIFEYSICRNAAYDLCILDGIFQGIKY